MNKTVRHNVLVSMNRIIQTLSDDAICDKWDSQVPETGDIDSYLEDENFTKIMGLFLTCIREATEDGIDGAMFVDHAISLRYGMKPGDHRKDIILSRLGHVRVSTMLLDL